MSLQTDPTFATINIYDIYIKYKQQRLFSVTLSFKEASHTFDFGEKRAELEFRNVTCSFQLSADDVERGVLSITVSRKSPNTSAFSINTTKKTMHQIPFKTLAGRHVRQLREDENFAGIIVPGSKPDDPQITIFAETTGIKHLVVMIQGPDRQKLDALAALERIATHRVSTHESSTKILVNYINNAIYDQLVSIVSENSEAPGRREAIVILQEACTDSKVRPKLVDYGIIPLLSRFLAEKKRTDLVRLALEALKQFFTSRQTEKALVENGVLRTLISYVSTSTNVDILIPTFKLLRYFDEKYISDIVEDLILRFKKLMRSQDTPAAVSFEILDLLLFLGTKYKDLVHKQLSGRIFALSRDSDTTGRVKTLEFIRKFGLVEEDSQVEGHDHSIDSIKAMLESFEKDLLAPASVRLQILDTVLAFVTSSESNEKEIFKDEKLPKLLVQGLGDPNEIIRQRCSQGLHVLKTIGNDVLVAKYGLLAKLTELVSNMKLPEEARALATAEAIELAPQFVSEAIKCHLLDSFAQYYCRIKDTQHQVLVLFDKLQENPVFPHIVLNPDHPVLLSLMQRITTSKFDPKDSDEMVALMCRAFRWTGAVFARCTEAHTLQQNESETNNDALSVQFYIELIKEPLESLFTLIYMVELWSHMICLIEAVSSFATKVCEYSASAPVRSSASDGHGQIIAEWLATSVTLLTHMTGLVHYAPLDTEEELLTNSNLMNAIRNGMLALTRYFLEATKPATLETAPEEQEEEEKADGTPIDAKWSNLMNLLESIEKMYIQGHAADKTPTTYRPYIDVQTRIKIAEVTTAYASMRGKGSVTLKKGLLSFWKDALLGIPFETLWEMGTIKVIVSDAFRNDMLANIDDEALKLLGLILAAPSQVLALREKYLRQLLSDWPGIFHRVLFLMGKRYLFYCSSLVHVLDALLPLRPNEYLELAWNERFEISGASCYVEAVSAFLRDNMYSTYSSPYEVSSISSVRSLGYCLDHADECPGAAARLKLIGNVVTGALTATARYSIGHPIGDIGARLLAKHCLALGKPDTMLVSNTFQSTSQDVITWTSSILDFYRTHLCWAESFNARIVNSLLFTDPLNAFVPYLVECESKFTDWYEEESQAETRAQIPMLPMSSQIPFYPSLFENDKPLSQLDYVVEAIYLLMRLLYYNNIGHEYSRQQVADCLFPALPRIFKISRRLATAALQLCPKIESWRRDTKSFAPNVQEAIHSTATRILSTCTDKPAVFVVALNSTKEPKAWIEGHPSQFAVFIENARREAESDSAACAAFCRALELTVSPQSDTDEILKASMLAFKYFNVATTTEAGVALLSALAKQKPAADFRMTDVTVNLAVVEVIRLNYMNSSLMQSALPLMNRIEWSSTLLEKLQSTELVESLQKLLDTLSASNFDDLKPLILPLIRVFPPELGSGMLSKFDIMAFMRGFSYNNQSNGFKFVAELLPRLSQDRIDELIKSLLTEFVGSTNEAQLTVHLWYVIISTLSEEQTEQFARDSSALASGLKACFSSNFPLPVDKALVAMQWAAILRPRLLDEVKFDPVLNSFRSRITYYKSTWAYHALGKLFNVFAPSITQFGVNPCYKLLVDEARESKWDRTGTMLISETAEDGDLICNLHPRTQSGLSSLKVKTGKVSFSVQYLFYENASGAELRVGWCSSDAFIKVDSWENTQVGDFAGSFAYEPLVDSFYQDGQHIPTVRPAGRAWYDFLRVGNTLQVWLDCDARTASYTIVGAPRGADIPPLRNIVIPPEGLSPCFSLGGNVMAIVVDMFPNNRLEKDGVVYEPLGKVALGAAGASSTSASTTSSSALKPKRPQDYDSSEELI